MEITFEEEAIEAIAQKAMDRKTGARGLRSIVESVMVDIMYELPSLEGSKKVTITRNVIENGTKPEIAQNKKSA